MTILVVDDRDELKLGSLPVVTPMGGHVRGPGVIAKGHQIHSLRANAREFLSMREVRLDDRQRLRDEGFDA
jgi:hypothetical protein